MTRPWIAVIGRLALVAGGLVLAALVVLAGAVGPRYGRIRRTTVAVQAGSRILLRSFGIRLVRRGAVRDGAALVVANRVSWVDVLVISASAPVVPVAGCEIAGWPVIGGLARCVGTVFVQRRTCRELPDEVARITAMLRRGHRVLIFPEATTTGGAEPSTFHPAGFQAAVDAAAPVVPVSIGYTDGSGRSIAATAFVGDDDLLASAWWLLRAGPVEARAGWSPAVPAIQDGAHRAAHRRRVASRSHSRITRSLSAISPIPGRPVNLEPPGRAA